MTKTLTILIVFFLSINHLKGQIKLNTKSIGQNILTGKTIPTDDIETFRTLDSLLCKNQSDKKFYFKVSNKIQQKSDGALSEYVSMVFCNYFFNQTPEFIENVKTLSKHDLNKWLDFIAFNLYAESKNGKKDLLAIRAKLKRLEIKGSGNEIVVIKNYNDYIYKKTEDLIKTD